MGDQEHSGRRVEIPAADGFVLGGTLFEPEARIGRSVIVATAMAAPQTYYQRFARFLASRGFTVLTFDYRGIGSSKAASARKTTASLYQWARDDIAGVIAWMRKLHPHDLLLYVGHSVGTQLLGLTPALQQLDAVVAITAPNGYWKFAPNKAYTVFWWYFGFPLLLAVLGYFPASRLGLGEDLPGGVARDWARWARTPGYVVDERGEPSREPFRAYRGPVLAWSFADDPRASRRGVEELLSYFSNASVDHRHLRPEQLDVKTIGHMGFFRDTEAARRALWEPTATWLATVA